MRTLRSTGLRLGILYTVIFALAVVTLGAVTILATRVILRRDLDIRIQAEAVALEREYEIEGLEGVVQAVRERDRTPGALDYGFQSADGKPLAGRLATAVTPDGWVNLGPGYGDNGRDRMRVFTLPFDGQRLLVGEDIERLSTLDRVLLRAFGLAFLGIVGLGIVAGLAWSRNLERRFGAMSMAAEAIIDGDMTRRIPLKGADDDLDALAATFNRMLDRIATLMETLKQVSNDIAHDLRTPLTRLRQKLETSLEPRDEDERRARLESALREVDSLLEVFAALLRIAQVESGARRAGFSQVDLGQIAAGIVEAFGPSAEEGGRRLSLKTCAGPLSVHGDKELLTQMLANLVENSLCHTPPGSAIEVGVGPARKGVKLWVRDDGPGVPPEEAPRLFERFVRLEASRSTPGSGLGLALVAAVVRLHDAEVELTDAAPGLLVRVTFPEAWRDEV